MRNGNWTLHATIRAEVDAAGSFTNMPAADTFLFNSPRHVAMIESTGMTNVRLKVNKQAAAGAASAKLRLCYSPTFSTSVGTYKEIGLSEVSVAINVTNSCLDSGRVELTPDVFAYDDIYLAVVGSGGDGALDPQFGNISVSFS